MRARKWFVEGVTNYNKFGAKKVKVDGFTFDSKREAERYGELKMFLAQGWIRNLEVHKRFPLEVLGTVIGHYEADFVFEARRIVTNSNKFKPILKEGKNIGSGKQPLDWIEMVEDVKGFPTPLYRWKKKHFEKQYKMEITEIK